MKRTISIQIHDYDNGGIYRIVEDKKVTTEELLKLHNEAINSVKVDWSKLPEGATHIVYYAEMLNEQREVWFAGIYMKGEAYSDEEFYRIFTAPNIGYVGAIHKH